MAKQAELAESGSSVSLADASRLISTEVLYPTTPQVAAEKLYAWSTFVDIFHGIDHEISEAVRAFVLEVGPSLHHIFNLSGTPAVGMDSVNRVLYEAQQDYFMYINALIAGKTPRCPDFVHITNAVGSSRVTTLSAVPAAWYSYLPAAQRPNVPEPRQDRQDPRHTTGSAGVFNSNADSRLIERFRCTGFTRISEMTNGHDVKAPKVNGKEVCLVWALKGSCSTSCAHKDLHNRYSRETINKIHTLMDDCGVANSQP